MTSVNVKKPIVLNTFFMLPRLHSMSKDGMLKDIIYAHNTGGGCNFSTGSSRIMTGTNSGFCKRGLKKDDENNHVLSLNVDEPPLFSLCTM